MGVVVDFSTGLPRESEDETSEIAQEMMRVAKSTGLDPGRHDKYLFSFSKALADADFQFCMEQCNLIERVHPRVHMIDEHLRRLGGEARRRSAVHESALRFTSMGDLCHQILEHTEHDWSAKPSYYVALVSVFRQRIAGMYERVGGPYRA